MQICFSYSRTYCEWPINEGEAREPQIIDLRYPEAKEYYCLGMSTLKKVAKEAGAIIHLGKIALVDTEMWWRPCKKKWQIW